MLCKTNVVLIQWSAKHTSGKGHLFGTKIQLWSKRENLQSSFEWQASHTVVNRQMNTLKLNGYKNKTKITWRLTLSASQNHLVTVTVLICHLHRRVPCGFTSNVWMFEGLRTFGVEPVLFCMVSLFLTRRFSEICRYEVYVCLLYTSRCV